MTLARNNSAFLSRVRSLLLGVVLLLTFAPVASAQNNRLADWLRTVRDTPLWSGSSDPALQFTTLPLGSLAQAGFNKTLWDVTYSVGVAYRLGVR